MRPLFGRRNSKERERQDVQGDPVGMGGRLTEQSEGHVRGQSRSPSSSVPHPILSLCALKRLVQWKPVNGGKYIKERTTSIDHKDDANGETAQDICMFRLGPLLQRADLFTTYEGLSFLY